jgi:hypothetical protein
MVFLEMELLSFPREHDLAADDKRWFDSADDVQSGPDVGQHLCGIE